MNTIYEPSSICMIRTPLLSVEFFNLFLNTEQIKYSDLQLNAQMKESILTTTFNLYCTLQEINFDGDNKKVRDAKESLLKYLIRMSTRPTPFGLLSGINLGHFVNEPTRLKVGNSIQKYVKVDGEWLYKLVSYIESIDEYYQNLKVIWNSKAHIINDRIYLNEQSAIYLNNNKDTSFSIKNSELLVFIKTTVTNNNITFSNLAEKINQEFEINDITKVKVYIHNLVSKEIIYSTIRPPLSYSDNLNYILNKLSLHNDDFVKKIREIQKLILAYEKTEIGFGEELYKDIIHHMKALFKCKNYLQIDTKIDMINNYLHQDIATNISEAAYLLWLLSRNNIGFTDLKVLHNRFIEKYGFEQLVNIKDLISDITGFGTTIFQEEETDGNNIVMLKQKFLHALRNNDEIVINEKDVESLINDNEIEAFFEYDTNLAVNIIENDFKFDRPYIVAISIMYLFEMFSISNEERMEIVNNYVPTSFKSKDIRPFKNELVTICNPANNFEYMAKHYSGIYRILKDGNQILSKLNEGLKKTLTTKRSRIIGSLIYMRCNRIFGIDKDQETFVLSIVKEIVKTQKHWCGDKND
ncbi:Epidermin biosynthesis protein EpiB [Staphylococcus aureus]|nr:Epidermin biosynthesis protein EpiB [Staphylococcus aureus]CAA3969978.1 Epidermin biosynthesis protein EpiB [Staphylococcus aureus]CAA4031416.1 Epidermin biosynthesis protein EpiB [Staphylococcus aureus]CAA4050719.1 Epidermin biosynthesis protein EpiB [Staphylococcus aureus]